MAGLTELKKSKKSTLKVSLSFLVMRYQQTLMHAQRETDADARFVPVGPSCTDLAYGKTNPTINRERSEQFASPPLSARGNYL